MTVFDPSLDQSQKPFLGRPNDAHEVLSLRHDIDRSMGAVLAGLTGVAAAPLDERARELLDQAQTAAQTLAGLMRIMRGEGSEPEEVGIAKLLARVVANSAADARLRGVRLETVIGDDAPAALLVDRASLHRVLDNLVDNALRFSTGGTVTVAVSRNVAGEIVFRVTDEGPGLDGSGIDRRERGEPRGLDIVQVLADRLGGAVSLGNRPGGAGTEAVLRLPASGGVELSPPSLDGVRILLAEDNLTNQMVALQMLRSLGAAVTVCSDGIEALERFDGEDFDLVIVDIEMPRMSGLDVIRAIRGRGDAKAETPIVALTAYAMREHRERIAAVGANELISKPVTSVEALGRSLAAHVFRTGEVPGAGAAPRTGDDAGPVIDAATYAALCEAIGPDLIAELLNKVISDLMSAQADLVGGAGPVVDRNAIRSASHILISVAGALGALRLQASARALNGAAHTEAEETLVTAVAGCAAEIDRAVAFARERRGAL
jgi:two-component system, OmpR family, aerobic respiration control sensor histidine kinase ArcB